MSEATLPGCVSRLIDRGRKVGNVTAGVTLGKREDVRDRIAFGSWLAAAAAVPAIAYALAGPGWIREDWNFVAARGDFSPGWFWPFRALAWPFHIIMYAAGSPVVALVVQTGLVVLAGVLFGRVVERFTADPQLGRIAAVVWVVLPIHSAMSFWAAGAYITAAACAALQALRTDRMRWVVVAGLLYESTVVPLVLIAVVRRQWTHAAIGVGLIAAATVWSPMDAQNVWVSPGEVATGTFGLGVSTTVGVLVLGLLISQWRTRGVLAGLVVVGVGVLMFLPYGQDIDFAGIGDRANVVAGFGVALAVAAGARVIHRPVVAVLLCLSILGTVDYADRAAAERTIDCSSPPVLDWTNEGAYKVLCR